MKESRAVEKLSTKAFTSQKTNDKVSSKEGAIVEPCQKNTRAYLKLFVVGSTENNINNPMDKEDNNHNAIEGNINIIAADFARLLSDGEIDISILDKISSNFGLMSPSLLYALSSYGTNTEIN